MHQTPITMQAWVSLHRAHARVLGELSRRMERERGVSVLEHGSLYELNAAPGRRLRMAELAERLGLSPSATTRLVDRLERRSWVRRELPPENRRIIHVLITSEGRRAYVRNNRHFTAAVEDALGAWLSTAEMTALLGMLGRLCAASPSSALQAGRCGVVGTESLQRRG